MGKGQWPRREARWGQRPQTDRCGSGGFQEIRSKAGQEQEPLAQMQNPRGVKVKAWAVFGLSHGGNWLAARVKFGTMEHCPSNLRKEREGRQEGIGATLS